MEKVALKVSLVYAARKAKGSIQDKQKLRVR